MGKFWDPAPQIVAMLRAICDDLPETHEAPAWAGTRWLVRRHSIAHVFTMAAADLMMDTEDGSLTAVMFRSTGPEFDALRGIGRPFIVLRGWRNTAMMELDEATDWREVRELVTESYCVMAPKKLVALIDRPEEGGS